MDFEDFDDDYLARLRAGEYRTWNHFVQYFSELMRIKLWSKVKVAEEIEEIIQETFSRVFRALHAENGIRDARRFGSYVNSTCNHVFLEFIRKPRANGGEEIPDMPDPRMDAVGRLMRSEVEELVQRTLDALSAADRKLIRQVVLDPGDKDQICREMGITRENLRTRVHRALKRFGDEYRQRYGAWP